MHAKLKYSIGAAIVALTLGSVALAAAPVAPTKIMPVAPPTPSAQTAPDSTWTASVSPTTLGDAPSDAVTQDAQLTGRPMMRGGLGRGSGQGYSWNSSMMRGNGYGRSFQNERRGSKFLPLFAVAACVTLLLAWTVLVLMTVALVRHLRAKAKS